MKCKNTKGKGMRTDEQGQFSGLQRGPSTDEHQLRTSLREIISDVLQKGYEKGWGKGCAQGFEKGYHKGWGDARLQDQHEAKKESPDDGAQEVKSEASPDDGTVEVKSEA